MINKDDVVLVTGANGYIASWLVKKLLELGCTIRGTVRDPKNEKKVKHLKELPGAAERLELVALDLNNESQFDEVCQGVNLIAHTASPFPSEAPKHEDDLIKPAVNGTLGILKAASKVPSVRAIVLTSSVVAVGFGTSVASNDPSKKLGENDWTDLSKAAAYDKSKTLAEKAAWDFWNEQGKPFMLCTINPSFVMGPMLSPEITTSVQMMKRFLNLELPVVPEVSFGFVDVRDVAQAHINALQLDTELVNGRRFILDNGTIWLMEMAQRMKATFGPMGYFISTIPCPYSLFWAASFIEKGAALVLPSWGIFVEYDSTPSREVLKLDYTDLQKTFDDGGHAAIYLGIVSKKKNYTPPSPDWKPHLA